MEVAATEMSKRQNLNNRIEIQFGYPQHLHHGQITGPNESGPDIIALQNLVTELKSKPQINEALFSAFPGPADGQKKRIERKPSGRRSRK
jgi:hypothetical protein